ncbi:hypothetical protein FPHYL_2905 [Fusarium phyllophilum]|uniref:Uncharacterized protein n=1 Tax=Fusarium phyllophilum TaxID=47803 RepID=A0A8H5K5N2_9HYPO|nr:hypothetical protein FPHYL_2905 [Fusarium phyllophilum]
MLTTISYSLDLWRAHHQLKPHGNEHVTGGDVCQKVNIHASNLAIQVCLRDIEPGVARMALMHDTRALTIIAAHNIPHAVVHRAEIDNVFKGSIHVAALKRLNTLIIWT